MSTTTDDAPIDTVLAAPACASVAFRPGDSGSMDTVCPTTAAESITITASTILDTDTGISTPPGVTCVPLAAGSTPVCAVSARAITIAAGATFSARGRKPVVLIGHTIDLQGIIDVSSRSPQVSMPAVLGAGGNLTGCQIAARALGDGGGQGGTFNGAPGGPGGDGDDTIADRGGAGVPSIGVATLRGGCPGGAPVGAGGMATGGAGGGAVWLAVDGDGTITLGEAAAINASGAGGLGGLLANTYHGGAGGGSGGMILFTGGTLKLATTVRLFANGGGGGAGASSTAAVDGNPGGESIEPSVGGAPGVNTSGPGGNGFPSTARTGTTTVMAGDGGGGGGGGAGTIWRRVTTVMGVVPVSNTSPPLVPIPGS